MGCGIEIVKYLVFIFNLVFSLIGIALLVIGAFFHLKLGTMSKDEVSAVLLIVVGAIVFLVSFFGCVGAIRGNRCMLITYSSFLLVLLILQVCIGVYDFIALQDHESIQSTVREDIQDMFDKYNATQTAAEDLDTVQQFIKCCGVNGPEDWMGSIPKSCCGGGDENKGACKKNDVDLFKVGCAERGAEKMVSILRAIGYVLFATCVWEIIGIFCAIFLLNSLKNQYRRGVYA